MINEIWKDLKGYENEYLISNLGKIISKYNNKEKSIFKRAITNKLMVGLNKNGKTYTQSIDKLLYENFSDDYNIQDYNKNETWKDIKGCEGRYQVSNLGNVRSLDRYINQTSANGIIYSRFMKGKLLSSERNNGNGYLCVQLPDGVYTEKEENHYIHQLVAETFIPNPENKPTVNHKDANKDNNNVDNLEWATQSEQMIHAYSMNLIDVTKINTNPICGEKHYNSKLSESQVREIYSLANSEGYTEQQIAEMYGVTRKNVDCIKHKKTWKHILN